MTAADNAADRTPPRRVQIACDDCSHGVMDADNPHLTGQCQHACHTDAADPIPHPADPQRWLMFAGVNDRHGNFEHVAADRRYAQAYGHTDPVAVVVPDGEYLGWIGAGDDEPVMIQPHPNLYRMQFPYGPDAEEERGRGRTVKLHITEQPGPADPT